MHKELKYLPTNNHKQTFSLIRQVPMVATFKALQESKNCLLWANNPSLFKKEKTLRIENSLNKQWSSNKFMITEVMLS